MKEIYKILLLSHSGGKFYNFIDEGFGGKISYCTCLAGVESTFLQLGERHDTSMAKVRPISRGGTEGVYWHV